MNEAFYELVLQRDPSALLEDTDHVIWIDWRDEEDVIVSTISNRLSLDELSATCAETDNDSGYVVVVRFENATRVIDPDDGFDSRHATLNTIDELLEPEFQIRFAADTNGSDTLGILIERTSDWQSLYDRHGRVLNEHFCPIREMPDLMNTPGNEIDDACSAYADRIG